MNKMISAIICKRPHFLVVALLIQIISLMAIGFLVITQSFIELSVFEWSITQSLLAGFLAYHLRMPKWWILIHLIFMPLVIITLALNISPLWHLFLFICLILVYGKTYKTRVPLYLSSQQVNKALKSRLPKRKHFSFLDLGSGCGGLISRLAKAHKNGLFYGIETAPIPFLISKLRNIFTSSSCKISWGDFWQHDFSQYDVVYAYLSPVPMETLWYKVRKEMRPGSLLISNTFQIPGVVPDEIIELNDFSNSTLYLWKIKNIMEP